MSGLTLIQTQKFGNIQCDFYGQENEIWMTRKQIGEALGYADPQKAIDKLHERNKDRLDKYSVTVKLGGTDGKMYNTVVYNAKGIYEICRWSKQAKANEFMDWAWEVVESIRKHGAYMTENTLQQALTNPDFLIQLATNLKAEQEARALAEQKLEKQEPLVAFAETCMKSEKSLLVREVAKLCCGRGVSIGEKRLWQKLRDWGLVFKGKTEPKQEYVDRGYFEVSQGVKENSKGAFTWITMRVTPKGQAYIVNRLNKERSAESVG